MAAVPEVSLLISYKSRTKRTPLTVSGTQSIGGKDPCPAQRDTVMRWGPHLQGVRLMVVNGRTLTLPIHPIDYHITIA